ncbi:MAG: sigma-70 family RNA polymerase sigma factor [Lentisphaeria bacterium]|nr:sigma-70 family RNA polymerase sigma factor [Lentisphaeria bacterium]
MSYTTSVGMLDEVRNRSDAGCERFYRTYRPLVIMHGRDCGIPGPDLDDLVQIVMTDFFRNDRFVYDAGKGRFRSFLRRIVHFRSMDMLRIRRRELRNGGCAEFDEEYSDRRDDEEWREFVRDEALRRLHEAVPPERFQQFWMLAVECRSVREVAHFFHAPEATVYSNLRRTRKALEKIVRNIEREAF